uniref:Uncharacterized protein n=1 Tax=Chromera velia CCMP2878 TaxID=1169474 RepID=A0A0G4F1H2_9ALVE|eukprot:Cvel_14521.t1-p1 / transcript=Cvel_14521.t1 / gene=Cvel_14521 / organism=Chromera_velia_CCMP2878 / gene_product=hypothetical protein / transcript_product=hypothetical protein / location=Cvel_scaffold1037:17191-17814(-) / protein_length=208 / sequence_SO=supercontig / SO=protein_coding / is_pseudo=false
MRHWLLFLCSLFSLGPCRTALGLQLAQKQQHGNIAPLETSFLQGQDEDILTALLDPKLIDTRTQGSENESALLQEEENGTKTFCRLTAVYIRGQYITCLGTGMPGELEKTFRDPRVRYRKDVCTNGVMTDCKKWYTLFGSPGNPDPNCEGDAQSTEKLDVCVTPTPKDRKQFQAKYEFTPNQKMISAEVIEESETLGDYIAKIPWWLW